MHNIHFVPECYAETEMVKHLFEIKSTDVLNHASGIGDVSNKLKKDDIRNYINIGFIDNDKKSIPRYFDEFKIIEENNLVIFKKHPSTNDYIFVVKPAIDKFILEQLSEIKKSPSDYDFPNDLKNFCKKTKSIHIQHNEKYKELILDLKNADTSGISFIIKKVNELRNQENKN